jgi:hypothetical protein
MDTFEAAENARLIRAPSTLAGFIRARYGGAMWNPPKRSTSDAVAEFFAEPMPKPLARLEAYMESLAREQVWTAEQLTEIRRAILKWMEE